MVAWEGLIKQLWKEEKQKAKEKRKDIPFECRVQKNSKERLKKKSLPSDQCKEIEENARMGKTRDLFKKIRGNKGTFHANMAQ